MLKTSTRICTVILISLLVFLPRQNKACGWDPYYDEDVYRFFSPELMQMHGYMPFQFSFDFLYKLDTYGVNSSYPGNVADWGRYFKGVPRPGDIEYLVYKSSLTHLRTAIRYVEGGKTEPEGELGQNSLVHYLKRKGNSKPLVYLEYAKRCEPLVYLADDWRRDPIDMEEANSLIEEGMNQAALVGDDFLALRYLYQAIRLAHYSGQYDRAVQIYRGYAGQYQDHWSIIRHWCRSQYAGALRGLGKNAMAAYEFSRVFEECPSKRIEAWTSFRISFDYEWDQVMSYCKNAEEKATIHTMKAIRSNAVAPEEMRNIMAVAPGSQKVDLLLLREINKLENTLFGFPFSKTEPAYDRLNTDEEYGTRQQLQQLRALVRETLASGKMADPLMWQIADGYLDFLNGDLNLAMSKLKLLPHGDHEDGIRVRMVELAIRLGSLHQVGPVEEDTMLDELRTLSSLLNDQQSEMMRKWLDDCFAAQYDRQGMTGKGLLARRQVSNLLETGTLDVVNDLLDFEAKPDKTDYELELQDRLRDSWSHDHLLEYKGTQLMRKNLLPEAIAIFEEMSYGSKSQNRFFVMDTDPFETMRYDYVNCEMDCYSDQWNKQSFAEELIRLQKLAIQEPSEAATAYLKLGNAFYNTTYFGHSWKTMDYFRSSGSWYYIGRYGDWYNFDPNNFDEHIDVSLAKTYYEKAYSAAKDPESKALAAFLAAKCERMQWYIDGFQPDRGPYYQNYAKLARLSQTSTYQNAISVCSYFNYYVSNY